MPETQFWQWSWTCEITLFVIAALCTDVTPNHIFGEDKYVSSGSNVTLICPIKTHSVAPVTWLKTLPRRTVARGSTLFTVDSHIRIEYDMCHGCSILLLNQVTSEDSGIYFCRETISRTKRFARSARISVKYAPKTSAKLQVVDVSINSSADLECAVSAYPQPDVTWFHENQEVCNDSQHHIYLEEYGNGSLLATLRLLFVNEGNLGNYTCHAKNKEGATSMVFILQGLQPEVEMASNASNSTISASTEGGHTLTLMTTFNVTGFILGMMPPIWISFYIILHLGFRSRYAEERPEEEGGDGLDEITYMAIV